LLVGLSAGVIRNAALIGKYPGISNKKGAISENLASK